METLGQKQRRFVQLFGLLIEYGYQQGFEMTFGEAFRSDEQAEINALGKTGRAALAELLADNDYQGLAYAIGNNVGGGIKNSLHCVRLAVDINLFKDGKYLTDSEDYKVLGDYWKSLGLDCAWGGDFKPKPDGNHFSIEFQGRK